MATNVTNVMKAVMKAHLIANSRSGKGAGGTLPEVAHKICQENNVELVHHEVREGVDMDQLAAEAVDVASEDELHDALQAARNRTGTTGRVIVEGADCPCANGLSAIRAHALAAGLDVVSFDHLARRLVLAPVQSARLAA